MMFYISVAVISLKYLFQLVLGVNFTVNKYIFLFKSCTVFVFHTFYFFYKRAFYFRIVFFFVCLFVSIRILFPMVCIDIVDFAKKREIALLVSIQFIYRKIYNSLLYFSSYIYLCVNLLIYKLNCCKMSNIFYFLSVFV